MNRAERLCADMPESIKEHAIELAENVFFMEGKLIETRNGLANQQVVIAYDNGGGQKGIRKNPIFEGYNQLMANYRKTLEQLVALLREYGKVNDTKESPLAALLAEADAILAHD